MWARRPIWTGAENLAPTGIRSTDRLARRVFVIPTELYRPLGVNKYTLQYVTLRILYFDASRSVYHNSGGHMRLGATWSHFKSVTRPFY